MGRDGSSDKVSVVLVEDEALYRDLLRIVLSQHPRLDVVGAFTDGPSALARVPDLGPRVAILDIELPGGMNGIQLGLQLRRQLPSLGIVLLSNHSDPQFMASLPREAAAGWSYLLKKSVSDAESLGRAIEGAASGFVVLDPQLIMGLRPPADSPLARLTPRQRQILELIAEGYTNAAIARSLVLAEKSVENQINLLYQHLELDRGDPSVHPRVRAVLTYLHEGLQPGAPGPRDHG